MPRKSKPSPEARKGEDVGRATRSELQNARPPRRGDCVFLSLGSRGDATVTRHPGRRSQMPIVITIALQAESPEDD